jgi:TldD protein
MKQAKSFINAVLNQLQLKNVDYADVRLVKTQNKNIASKDGVIEAFDFSLSFGFNVRVLKNGSWGFAASALDENLNLNTDNKKIIAQIINQAVNLAQSAQDFNKLKFKLKPLPPVKDSFKTSYKIDPFTVKDSQIINMLLKADKAQKIDQKIKISQAFFSCRKQEKIFASTEGSLIDQEILYTGAGIEATAINNQEVQNRSYPNSFRGQFTTQGYETVAKMKLIKKAPEIASQAIKLTQADNCPAGEYDLIIDSNQLALQVHESIGHALEFDRILGYEASFAGTSFVNVKDIGNLQYGSQHLNITADATLKKGLGSFGYDDEGMAAKRQYLIKNGKLINVLTSRKTAQEYNLAVTGAMRAEGSTYIPLVRMTNINLEPGSWKLKDLVQDTKKGLFLSTNRSWSIDDKRLNFQFGTEAAWEIKNGKLGKIYKNPIYAGTTVDFWHKLDAVCNKNYWQIWGTPNCGKGEPVQTIHVGHGTAPARFKNIKVFPG